MSLIATLQAGVESAFLAAAELVRLGTYNAKGGVPVYDPDTDTMTSTPSVINNVRMLETSSQAEEREASPVTVGDSKFLIPFVDLPGIIPSETDTLTLDGVGYNILIYKKVPGQAIHIVFCRKK